VCGTTTRARVWREAREKHLEIVEGAKYWFADPASREAAKDCRLSDQAHKIGEVTLVAGLLLKSRDTEKLSVLQQMEGIMQDVAPCKVICTGG